MSEDPELEALKAKRLAEMQKNISSQKDVNKTEETSEDKPVEDKRSSVVSQLGFRGMEVLENAESQFPNETKMIVDKLAELIKTGELNETIDGGQLDRKSVV